MQIRRSTCLHPRDTAPAVSHDTLEDPLWLGGEAMIAPDCLSDWRDASCLAADECADPGWLAI